MTVVINDLINILGGEDGLFILVKGVINDLHIL